MKIFFFQYGTWRVTSSNAFICSVSFSIDLHPWSADRYHLRFHLDPIRRSVWQALASTNDVWSWVSMFVMFSVDSSISIRVTPNWHCIHLWKIFMWSNWMLDKWVSCSPERSDRNQHVHSFSDLCCDDQWRTQCRIFLRRSKHADLCRRGSQVEQIALTISIRKENFAFRRDLTSFLKRQQRFYEYVDPDEGNGELTIFIPPSLRESHSKSNSATTDNSASPPSDLVYKVTIDFSLEQPEGGIHFFVPDDDAKLSRVRLRSILHSIPCRTSIYRSFLVESAFIYHWAWCSSLVSMCR